MPARITLHMPVHQEVLRPVIEPVSDERQIKQSFTLPSSIAKAKGLFAFYMGMATIFSCGVGAPKEVKCFLGDETYSNANPYA
jgi:hypothetical protein